MKRRDSNHVIHIVKRSDDPHHKNTRISFGEYFADVVYEPNSGTGHWIVQKVGSAAIIHWGQEETFADAEKCAKQYLEELMRKSLGISESLEA